MNLIITGACDPAHVFTLEDTSQLLEKEFEVDCARALGCLFSKYLVIEFRSPFVYNSRHYLPDLALIAKDFSHWFVVEVELLSHSLELHVLPQVKAFSYGDLVRDRAARVISQACGISLSQAETVATFVPRNVVVVANRFDSEWDRVLRTHDVQFASVSRFTSGLGESALHLDGQIVATKEVLAWASYSITDRSLRVPPSTRLPDAARLQIRDHDGIVAWWFVIRSDGAIWLTKESGTLALGPNQRIQIVRTYDGEILLRLPGLPG